MRIGSLSAKASRRLYWTCCTLNSPGDAPGLAQKAKSWLRQTKSKDAVILYALSSNTPASEADDLFSLLRQRPNSVGCMMDAGRPDTYTVSLAAWNQTASSPCPIVFRSTLTGKPQVAVGREVRPEMDQARNMSFDQNQAWSTQWGASASDQALPLELKAQNDLDEIIFFSDDRPHGLMTALDTAFPTSTKMGLVAGSTPFITGIPYTMLRGTTLVSNGAVGVAIPRQSRSAAALSSAFSGWTPLSHPVTVTQYVMEILKGSPNSHRSAQGNIVLALNGQPASRLLLQLLQQGKSITKEDEYYFGLVPKDLGDQPCPPERALTIAQVIAGSPTKGPMALDTEISVQEGSRGQFYVRANSESPLLKTTPIEGFSFHITQPNTSNDPALSDSLDSFYAFSEHGIIYGQRGFQSWISTLSGHTAHSSSHLR